MTGERAHFAPEPAWSGFAPFSVVDRSQSSLLGKWLICFKEAAVLKNFFFEIGGRHRFALGLVGQVHSWQSLQTANNKVIPSDFDRVGLSEDDQDY